VVSSEMSIIVPLLLKSTDDGIVFGVRTDPEPGDRVAIKKSKSSPANPDAGRVDGFRSADSLELDTGMRGVGPPESIGPSCLLPNMRRESGVAIEEVVVQEGIQERRRDKARTRPVAMF
jgi:hypothetical protein